MLFDDTSTVVEGDGATDTLYEVTIACEASPTNLAYTFVTPGPSNPRRMLRALCFFDNALFFKGTQRDQLLHREFDPIGGGRTHIMYAAMVLGYKTARRLCANQDADPAFYVVRATATLATPLVASPFLFPILNPQPINYPCVACVVCGKVQEAFEHTRDGEQCCAGCARA